MKKQYLILAVAIIWVLSLFGVYVLAATPGVSHSAEEIKPGKFGNGEPGKYTFPKIGSEGNIVKVEVEGQMNINDSAGKNGTIQADCSSGKCYPVYAP